MNSNLFKVSKSIIKEGLESVLRNARTFFVKKHNPEVLRTLKRDGLYVKSNALSDDECHSLISEIDRLLESQSVNVWRDENGADQRIYFAESISKKFKDFFDDDLNKRILKEYTGITNPVGFVLASKISYKTENQGSGGGWHRDSPFTHQFKSIYFLNTVTENNGPFQYVKASHKKTAVLMAYFKKIFNPGQYRFTSLEISNYEKKLSVKAESLVCEPGTLVYADTKGIHRGKPLMEGARYAIFCYYWDKKIPPHFNSLMQASE